MKPQSANASSASHPAPRPPADLPRRTQARMLAVQALCQLEQLGAAFETQLSEFLSDHTLHVETGLAVPIDEETARFARRLIRGAWAQHEECDRLLSKHAANWSLKRMAPVDRNVLRLALHELLATPEQPNAVVINEAIELARMFGDQESAAFVNGVLDAVRRGLDGFAAPVEPSTQPESTQPESTQPESAQNE